MTATQAVEFMQQTGRMVKPVGKIYPMEVGDAHLQFYRLYGHNTMFCLNRFTDVVADVIWQESVEKFIDKHSETYYAFVEYDGS